MRNRDKEITTGYRWNLKYARETEQLKGELRE